jgi:hypothetical protein
MVTATTRIRLEKQAYASNDEAWGDHLNEGVFDIVDEAVAGYVAKALVGDYTLDVQNYITDEARNATLKFTGTGSFTVTAPAVEKTYIIWNACTGDLTLKPSGGTGSVIRAGKKAVWFTDGTTGYTLDPTLDEIKTAAANVAMGGFKLTGVGTGTAATDAATLSNKVHQFAAPTSPLAMNNQKITGLPDGTATGDAVHFGQFATVLAESQADADAAAASALAAATSETNAAASAARLTGTSTTSLAIGTGSKAFTTQSGKFFDVGARVLATSDASPSTRSMFGIVTAYSGTSLTVDVSAIVGSGTYADWTIRYAGERGATGAAGTLALARSGRTSNTILGLADAGRFIDITSGTFTQTFDAAATLAANWLVYIRNSGTGVITLDPNASETIDGLTTIKVYPGEAFAVQCDGSALYTIGRQTMVLVQTQTIGSAVASVDFERGFDDTQFKSFRFIVEALSHNDAGSQIVGMRYKKSGSYAATGYTAAGPGGAPDLDNGGTIIGLSSAQAAADFVLSTIDIIAPFNATASRQAAVMVSATPSVNLTETVTARQSTAAALQGVQFLSVAGNLDSGTIHHYGLR